MAKKNVYQQLNFGMMPCDHIKVTLGMDLDIGNVTMSARAQQHASKKHPDTYNLCLPFIALILADPLYLGDDFDNEGKIEIIGRPPKLGQAILVAVEVTKDARGHYNVTSFYTLRDETVQNRRDKGRLLVAKNK